jgi:lipoprotein NlpI
MREPATGVWALDPPRILLLLGLRSDAINAARESRSRAERTVPWLYEWYGRVLDHDCGLISDDELLAAAGRERLHQCEAHFYIALTRLADGDRTGAAEHFRECIRTRIFDYIEYGWSRAFLARMDQDPTWPPWIPAKEGTQARRDEGTKGSVGVSPATQPAMAPQEDKP